ncbi:MAG: DMT family transporter [Nitratireductor sp.]|nr:DMT family transporter [Nitratireductor sp.]
MSLRSTQTRFLALSDNVKGSLILLAAAGLFATMTLIVKILGQHLHVTQILLVRQIVMAAIVAPSVLRGFPGVMKTTQPGLQIMRIALALGAMLMGFSAVIHMPLADATALGFAKSFFVTIFAIWVLGEQVGIRRWLAVALGFAGVIIMLQPGTDSFSVYGVMAVAGAACAGLVMVIIRYMSRKDSPTTILSWQAIGVGIVIAIPGILYWQKPAPMEWLLLITMGFTSYLAQMANIYAYKWGEASILASLDYVRLLYATLFGYLAFSTLPGTTTWVGSIVIVAASIYTIWREAQRKLELNRSPAGRNYTQ